MSQGQVHSILHHKDLALTNMIDVLQKQVHSSSMRYCKSSYVWGKFKLITQ